MKLYRSIAVVVCLSTLISASCSRANVEPSSSSGALTANTALNNLTPVRPFAKHSLNSAGASYLNEFIRPEVRARLDEEPVGDADGGFDPAASDSGVGSDQQQPDATGEEPAADAQQPRAENDEGYPAGSRLDTLKYSWAKKAFGDAVKAAPTNNGVIVLYADDNYYDLERLMGFVEEGRNRITDASAIGGERIRVVFGGFRATPQVELWIVPEGSPIPEFKPDTRPNPAGGQN